MDYTLFVNFIHCDNFIFEPLVEEKSALEFLVSRIENEIKASRVVALIPNAIWESLTASSLIPARWSLKKLSTSTNKEFLEIFFDFYKAGNREPFIVINGDAPFIDLQTTLTLLENHKKFDVELSNSDGFPIGLFGEIIAPEITETLLAMADESKVYFDKGATFFDYITPRINQFDIETHLAPKDYGVYRLSLTCRGVANTLLCQRVAEALSKKDRQNSISDDVLKLLDENPLWFRTRPNFFNIQITTKNNQRCSYFPWNYLMDMNELEEEMSIEGIAKIAKEVFEFCGEGVFTFWPIGEPALHSKIEKVIDTILAYPTFSLLIETNGIGWDRQLLQRLYERYQNRLIWVISLDTIDEHYYSQIRGEGFKEAFDTALFLSQLFKENCYCQSVRLKGGEEQLATFWKYWKEHGQPLITKYDHHCGLLEDLRVVDLSPVNRFACWHIKRDMTILTDGRVLLCKEDVRGSSNFGNVFSDGVAGCFEKLNSCYEKQCSGCFDGICENCDEYYTFNF